MNSSSSLEGSAWSSEGVSGRQGVLEAARLAKRSMSRCGMVPERISVSSVGSLASSTRKPSVVPERRKPGMPSFVSELCPPAAPSLLVFFFRLRVDRFI